MKLRNERATLDLTVAAMLVAILALTVATVVAGKVHGAFAICMVVAAGFMLYVTLVVFKRLNYIVECEKHFNSVLDEKLPNVCVVCGEPIEADKQVCNTCFEDSCRELLNEPVE